MKRGIFTKYGCALVLAALFIMPVQMGADDDKPGIPCGEYTADDAMYKTFAFQDDNTVIVHVMGLAAKETYTLKNGIIHLDNSLQLKMEGPERLSGYDLYTEGYTYLRTEEPEKPCRPLNGDAMPDCYATGLEMKTTGKLNEAKRQFQHCCDNENDARSCGQYGFMEAIQNGYNKKALAYFEKACGMGHGGGCTNLAAYAAEKGDTEQAKAYYKQACDLGDQKGCGGLAELEPGL